MPGPEHHFLINPYGMMFEEITASSLVKVDADGNALGNSPYAVNPAGFTIHSAVHEVSEDAGCVIHLQALTAAGAAARRKSREREVDAIGGDRRSAGARSSSQNENLKAFVADIAVKTGKGRSTVARDVTRAKKVAVLDDIAGTCLDKGDEIDALGKLPEGERRKLATAARAGDKVSAKARKPRQKGADTAVRTTTAEVDADPAASTERRKRAYAADEPEREAMTAKDAALREFDAPAARADNQQGRAGAVRQDERGR